MKMLTCCTFLSVFLCLAPLGAQTYNNMRVAYTTVGVDKLSQIPSGFYERARANGFNYILAEFRLDGNGWTNGRYTGNNTSGIYNRLRTEFIAADRYGMKLIPLFQTSDTHASHWADINNSKIGWQYLPANFDVAIRTAHGKKIPTFAPDSIGVNGFDSSFNDLLNVIYLAFNSARSSPGFSSSTANLDFIHFGADEPIFELSMNTGNTVKVVIAGLCQNDRDWLNKNNLGSAGTQNQIVALLGSNIKRKTLMIKAAGRRNGNHNTTALYYGDMLDPNLIGGADPTLCSFANLFDTVSTTATNIKTKDLATSSNVQAVKDSSIVVQWCYTRYYGGKDYNTDSTFRYFKKNNLKFLHGNALADENSLIEGERLHQFMEQAVVSVDPIFNNFVMGFVSFHWCSGNNYFNGNNMYNQVPAYKTMEFLSQILWHNAALFE